MKTLHENQRQLSLLSPVKDEKPDCRINKKLFCSLPAFQADHTRPDTTQKSPRPATGRRGGGEGKGRGGRRGEAQGALGAGLLTCRAPPAG